MFPIASLLTELARIKIVDVGAMSIGVDPYGARPGHTYLPYVIGDGTEQTYRSYDLAAMALEEHDRKTGSRLHDDYVARVASGAT